MRLAMIGGGPKSLFALLELNDALGKLQPIGQELSIHVDVYDPYPPGAGRVWNTSQPRELRLNVNSRIIDASSSLCAQNFDQWLAGRDKNSGDEDSFPARALVGEYLREQFKRLQDQGQLSVEHRPAAVSDVVRQGTHWEVLSEVGKELYDEVVLATGHGLSGYRPAGLAEGALTGAQLTVEATADAIDVISPGSEVVIRGAALTAYDVVLVLTEGRGGRWKQETSNGFTTLSYLPSGNEPTRITMTSRTTIPMSPKTWSIPAELSAILDDYRPQIQHWGKQNAACGTDAPDQPAANMEELWQILLACAVQCAQSQGLQRSATTLFNTVLNGQSANFAEQNLPAGQLRTSLRVNRRLEPVTDEWIWSIVWSGLYPQLVEAVSRIRWSAEDREQFDHRATQLERMAFGPPETTALKLLALFDAGILRHEAALAVTSAEAVCINAVTAPAGVLSASAADSRPAYGLFGSLLKNQEIHIRNSERGLLTDTDATCINAQGERTESLASLGRPTEGPTLGHDTLNRTLHPEYRRWAQRLATKINLASQKVAP